MPTYNSPYANNIPMMTNVEINSLAKNSFTDAATQLAISKHHYRLAKQHLAHNQNITQEAARELWDQRGHVIKSILLAHNAIPFSDEERINIYREHFKSAAASPTNVKCWRTLQAFMGSYHSPASTTPSVLLEELLDDLNPKNIESYTLRKFLSHRNCTLKIALKIGTMPVESADSGNPWRRREQTKTRDTAMQKVAELTKRDFVALNGLE